jgi:pimeloyl-ACP methyl ester carboxylesterase
MRLAYSDLGTLGEPIVILHGLFGSSRNWAAIAKKFSVSHRVFMLDLPIHGASVWTDTIDYEQMYNIISEFLVEHDLKGATILGHSMGGKVAMTLALKQPELIGRLIVADIAPVKYNHDNLSIITALEDVDLNLIKIRSDADKQLIKSIPEQMMRSFLLQNLVHGEYHYEWRINIPVLKKSLSTLQAFPSFSKNVLFDGPTLFLAGIRSDFIEQKHHKRIANFFPGSSIVEIADAGHWLHADNPNDFISSVTHFVSST